MNWKATVILVVIALGVAVVAYINPFQGDEEKKDDPPWFYQVAMDDIISIEVFHDGNAGRFKKVPPHAWVIDNPDEVPPDHVRWGGIVLLVSGPQTSRDFSTVRATVEDPAQYGLDDPKLVVEVGLTADRHLEFVLGDETADGSFTYGQVTGFPQLFLIADSWGKVLARLADEPPIPKWYVKRDPADIEEVTIYMGVKNAVEGPLLRLQQEDGEWFAKNLDTDEKNRSLDTEKWAQFIPMMAGPPDIQVESPRIEGRDYTQWGIEDDNRSIEIRFSGETDRGTRFIDGILYLLGDRTEDDRHYFATSASDMIAGPVLKLDAQWIDSMYELFDNLPYAESENAKAGSGA